jgi:aminopeptidase-like protein
MERKKIIVRKKKRSWKLRKNQWGSTEWPCMDNTDFGQDCYAISWDPRNYHYNRCDYCEPGLECGFSCFYYSPYELFGQFNRSQLSVRSLIENVGDFLEDEFNLFGCHQVLEIVMSYVDTFENQPGYYYMIPNKSTHVQDLRFIDRGLFLEALNTKSGAIKQYAKEKLQICYVYYDQINERSKMARPGCEFLQLLEYSNQIHTVFNLKPRLYGTDLYVEDLDFQNLNEDLLLFCEDQETIHNCWRCYRDETKIDDLISHIRCNCNVHCSLVEIAPDSNSSDRYRLRKN